MTTPDSRLPPVDLTGIIGRSPPGEPPTVSQELVDFYLRGSPAEHSPATRTLIDGWYAVRLKSGDGEWEIAKYLGNGHEDLGIDVKWMGMEDYYTDSCYQEIGPFLMGPAGPSRELLDEVKRAKNMRDTFGGETTP